MAISIKIHGSKTPEYNQNTLCNSCRYASRVEGETQAQHFVQCDTFSRFIPFKVTKCSSYSDAALQNAHDFNQIGWIMIRLKATTPDGEEQVTFVDNQRYNKLRREGLVD